MLLSDLPSLSGGTLEVLGKHKYFTYILIVCAVSCGPIPRPDRLSPTQVKEQIDAAKTQTEESFKTRIKDMAFSWDEKLNSCRNSLGKKGYNQNSLGPCSLILADPEQPQAELKNLLAKMEHKNLRGSMIGISLAGADLKGFDLRNTHFLPESSLEKTDLTDALLQEARLQKVNLSNAILTGTNLEKADLACAILTDTDLSQAKLDSAIRDCPEKPSDP